MTEQVIRHRGRSRDENGKLTGDTSSVTLTAIGVAPGVGSHPGAHRTERGRDGTDVAYTVYFLTGTDIVNSDELTVRGERFRVMVSDWFLGRGGLEVNCTRGQG